MKKIAIVVSGWHFPELFYKALATQQIPKGWIVELFVVAHRDPKNAKMPKFDKKTRRGRLDSLLYSKIITKKEIEALGWNYKEYPNTIGDWGNTNQWLEDNDYKKYDLFLFTHDDNLILRDDLLVKMADMYSQKWLIMTNSVGAPPGSIRGSFEFFKKEMLTKLKGKFDMSGVTLNRTGKTDNPKDWKDLYDWNNTVTPLTDFLTKKKLWSQVIIMSPQYRVSVYCIEGERGLISKTQPMNESSEEIGLDWLEENGII